MKKTGVANLPLHGGRTPPWLFKRMVLLSREIILALRMEYNTTEILRRISDPFWFQAFGCVLGFDWHSSGLTTTVCGAVKEALRDIGEEIGMLCAGGKGKTAINTPLELEQIGERTGINILKLKYASRMSAKVDNAALQDGYTLYHHSIFFSDKEEWCVVQQGMNTDTRYARRYHWLGEKVISFVSEPHSAVCSEKRENKILNLVAKESEKTREGCVNVLKEHPEKIIKETRKIMELEMPKRHYISPTDINTKRFLKTLSAIHEESPSDFETLLGRKGVGEKTLRALSFISEIIYGSTPSFKDPARFSFAHGGKDGHPYPVNRTLYDESIEILKEAISKAKLGYYEKLKALKRLSRSS